ncbi:putative fatty acyl-CoA reductase CG5065 [Cylas formicarius]|uniref:putative fatty acyl-CoA reductase CG5065 n=1 Tax=Cylas formicarius TaxID=197179 RepID=UPI00295839F8|nr:putative fatty acyl-CoA reductase CG5065 [Cylas formicarius]XP_060534284.1 putative fatty acyl-CoA reductase CG5065 [Cylas formicarius]XP_060534285.1 putative fatty acyl-CoA reductase CG5065 [Cylas formicarius]
MVIQRRATSSQVNSGIVAMSAIPHANGTAASASAIAEFYDSKTVFITGGTGFMGKVLLEKLLRSCPGVSKIYLLIRPKRGQEAQERLQQLLSSPLFDVIRKERPADLSKVLPIEGDITQPELAISVADRATLSRTVNVVFHSAATVKFDEKLKLSVTINVLGTQRLVELCKRMTNLQALIHVSTAYCNCDRSEVKEMVYPPTISPDQIVSLVDALDEDLVDQLTPKLVGNRPNTYTFTKALAECWLKDNRGDLPLVIVRPSIVLSSMDGPLKGWVDNWNGPTGILAAAGKGLFRTMLCQKDKVADLVPVDMVINLMVTSAWWVATSKPSDLPIYNCVTGMRKPVTWNNFIQLGFNYFRVHPLSGVAWYPNGTVTSWKSVNVINRCVLQLIPAYVLDAVTWLTGGKPRMVKIQDKLTKAATCLEYFTTHEWRFDDENVRKLSLTLSEVDRKEFCFDVEKINWETYIEAYVLGIRRFIFKEDSSTIPKARKHMSLLYWTYRLVQLIGVLVTWHFVFLRYAPLQRLWSNALKVLLHLARTLPFIQF